jgi:hypothetical protein
MPGWKPRYVIVERWPDLPQVAITAMAAEGYLPHAWLVRGRRWSPAPGRQGVRSAMADSPAEMNTAAPPAATMMTRRTGQGALHRPTQDQQ